LRFGAASLGFKLNLALLLFVLTLGVATSAIVLYGFNRSQDDATERSQEALEEQGKLALQALAGGVADAGVLQFEAAGAVGQRASRYLQEFEATGATPAYDTSSFVQSEDDIWYDADPERISDVFVVNHSQLEGGVLDDIAYSAPLEAILPVFTEPYPGEISGDAYRPIAISFIGMNGVGRSYPPLGLQDSTPVEVDLSVVYDRFGPVANPERVTVWTPPYEDRLGRGLVMTAQTPVYEGDTFRGIFEVDLSIAQLVALVNQLKPTPGGFTFYVDTEGQIMHTDAFDLVSREAGANPELAAVLDAMKAPEPQPGVFVETVTLDGEEFFIAQTSMPIPGGAIAVAAPVSEVTEQAAGITAGIDEEANRTFLAMLAAMGALFVVGLVGATFLNRALLLVPLRRLFAGTQAVAAGNLDTTVDLQRGDELGALAGSFNSMVEQLRESERGLERQVEERTRELTALLEVSRTVTSTLDLQELVGVILDQLHGILEHSGSAVLVKEGSDLVIKAARATDGADRELGARIPITEDSELQRTIFAYKPVIIDDIRGDSSMAESYRSTIAALGLLEVQPFSEIRSWMALPLVAGENVIGMLTMSRTTPGYFTEEHARIVAAFANQVSLAIENARLFEQTQTRTRELRALLEVSRVVSSTLDLGEVLGAILDELGAITEHTGASILLFREDALEFVDARSMTGTTAPQGGRIPFSAAPALSARLQRGDTVIIDDIRSDEQMAADYRAAIASIGASDRPPFDVIRSWMAVPLAVKDRVLGILTLSWTEPRHFTQEHARLARAFADQAAAAIENARLFAQTGQLAALEERQRLARELHDSVSQALYGIALGARTARTILDREPPKAIEPVDYVLSLAEAGLAEMRALIFELRPESLESEGLVAALEKQIAATRARYGLEITADLPEEPDISLERKEALYRIAQEALHNVVKHANATTVTVSLGRADGTMRLAISDNGRGFDAEGEFPGHLGLRSMRERAQRLGATINIHSTPGSGSSVEVELPGP
jgi:signal transduction histidine kinase/HAMP domain-containing protein